MYKSNEMDSNKYLFPSKYKEMMVNFSSTTFEFENILLVHLRSIISSVMGSHGVLAQNRTGSHGWCGLLTKK